MSKIVATLAWKLGEFSASKEAQNNDFENCLSLWCKVGGIREGASLQPMLAIARYNCHCHLFILYL